MKTTVMRRITTLLLTVVMLLSVAAPAVFAEDAVPGATETTGGNQNDYSKGVWLHAALGSFSGTYGNVDISGQPSVWVNFENPETRTLPTTLPTITAAKGGSVRWFTKYPTVTEVAAEDNSYSYRTATGNGEEVKPGGRVPDGVTTLYSTFDYSIPSAGDSDLSGKFVTFYLDWNGINGMYGHCLTCRRSLTEDGVKFTVESAAVANLNAKFTTEFENFMKNLEGKGSAEQWRMLTDYWAKNPVNGYTFKGWSVTPTGQPIADDTLITNGMSFYAVWEKGGQSNETFSRVDPAAGPAEWIRFENLSESRHAKDGASAQIQAAIGPTRAVAEITWTVTYKVGDKSLQETFTDNGQTFTVPHNGMHTGDGFRAVASGKTLTITNLDTTARSFVISASCQSEGGSVVTVPTAANVTFSHSWKLKSEQKPTCTADGKNVYTCEVCSATREETRKATDHVMSWEITKQPTCEEPGSKHLVCLYCDEEGETKSIPALGHKYTWVQREAPTCEHVGTKVQVCSVCGGEGASQSIPALGHLYSWVTTKEATCEQDGTMVQICQRAGCNTHGATQSISKLGHAFAWRTVKEATCEGKGLMEEYCVRSGCSATGKKVELEALGHTFKWIATKEPTTESEGVKTSKCSVCGKIVNETIPKLPKPAVTPTPTPTAAPTAKPTVSSAVHHNVSSTVQHAAAPTARPTAAPTVQHAAAPTVRQTVSSTVQHAAAPTVRQTVSSTVQHAASTTTQHAAAPTAAPTASSATQHTVSSTVQHTASTTTQHAAAPTATAQSATSVTGTAAKATPSYTTSTQSRNSYTSVWTGTTYGKSAQYLAATKTGGVTTSSSYAVSGSRLGTSSSYSSSLGRNSYSSTLTRGSYGRGSQSYGTSTSSRMTGLSGYGKSTASSTGSLTSSRYSYGTTASRTASVSGANKSNYGKVFSFSSYLTRY